MKAFDIDRLHPDEQRRQLESRLLDEIGEAKIAGDKPKMREYFHLVQDLGRGGRHSEAAVSRALALFESDAAPVIPASEMPKPYDANALVRGYEDDE